jgi:hypothetical protein
MEARRAETGACARLGSRQPALAGHAPIIVALLFDGPSEATPGTHDQELNFSHLVKVCEASIRCYFQQPNNGENDVQSRSETSAIFCGA